MRRASWALLATSALVFSACSSIDPGTPPPGTIHLAHAEFATSTPGDLMTVPRRTLGSLSQLQWQQVTLPYSVPRVVVPDQRSDNESVEKMDSVTTWYRLQVPDAQVSDELGELYLPRWHTYGSLAIYANGELIYSSIQEGNFASFNDPLLVRIPEELLAKHKLEIVVRMDSVRAIGGALSSLWVGPIATVKPMFDWRRTLQNRIPQITSSIFLVLGLFALVFWLRRRHESTQLLFFVLSVLFYIRCLHYYVDDVPIPNAWFSWLTINSMGWIIVVIFFFARSVHGRHFPIVERSLIVAMTIASLLTMPIEGVANSLAILSPLAYLILIAIAFSVVTLLTVVAWQARSIECGALVIVFWLNIAFGAHDLELTSWRTDLESIYLLPVGVVALFVMFLTTVLRRFLGALSASEKASALLEVRLADRERELKESYDKLRQIEQAQLLSNERQRLMREMHDGLGSALMSSLVAVERGQMQPGDIAQVLRECVDDLKLTIDSLEPVGDDLLILLATLRYRLEPRLQAAGIALSWEVESVPRLAWLNPGSALQVLRMLQEILTNILKHARAHSIRVATSVGDNEITITVADDGIGFDVDASQNTGRGLQNLKRRAADIGGAVEFDSKSNGTAVRIRLPIERRSEVRST